MALRAVELTKPQLSAKWMIYAVIGVVLLIAVYYVAQWIWGYMHRGIEKGKEELGWGS